VDFQPGTELGLFVVNLAQGESTTLLAAIEGPESDEVTLEGTDLSNEEVSGFTLSVHSSMLVEMSSDDFDALDKSGGEVVLTVDDDRFRITVTSDRHGRGNALIDLRNEFTDQEVATLAAIRGQEGFTFGVLEVLVPVVIIIVIRHRENMRAIELCVPLDNTIGIEIPGVIKGDAGTRVHKTEEQ
jgi:hypothetical protein